MTKQTITAKLSTLYDRLFHTADFDLVAAENNMYVIDRNDDDNIKRVAEKLAPIGRVTFDMTAVDPAALRAGIAPENNNDVRAFLSPTRKERFALDDLKGWALFSAAALPLMFTGGVLAVAGAALLGAVATKALFFSPTRKLEGRRDLYSRADKALRNAIAAKAPRRNAMMRQAVYSPLPEEAAAEKKRQSTAQQEKKILGLIDQAAALSIGIGTVNGQTAARQLDRVRETFTLTAAQKAETAKKLNRRMPLKAHQAIAAFKKK